MAANAYGQTEVECTMCPWAQPLGMHHTAGVPQRPAGADYFDEVLPKIALHVGATWHPVRVTLTTFHDDRPDERSSTVFGVDHNGNKIRTPFVDVELDGGN